MNLWTLVYSGTLEPVESIYFTENNDDLFTPDDPGLLVFRTHRAAMKASYQVGIDLERKINVASLDAVYAALLLKKVAA